VRTPAACTLRPCIKRDIAIHKLAALRAPDQRHWVPPLTGEPGLHTGVVSVASELAGYLFRVGEGQHDFNFVPGREVTDIQLLASSANNL
jgi:hypothetical protein